MDSHSLGRGGNKDTGSSQSSNIRSEMYCFLINNFEEISTIKYFKYVKGLICNIQKTLIINYTEVSLSDLQSVSCCHDIHKAEHD